jgi:hypothetical protein
MGGDVPSFGYVAGPTSGKGEHEKRAQKWKTKQQQKKNKQGRHAEGRKKCWVGRLA